MDDCHHVLGLFEDQDAAESARDRLVEQGLAQQQVVLFTHGEASHGETSCADDATRGKAPVAGDQADTVGGDLGDLQGLALVPENVSLFVADPLIDSLADWGWSAKLGGLLGPTTSVLADADIQPVGCCDALVRDATANGQAVLAVQTRTEPEIEVARDVMQTSVQDSHDSRRMASA